MITLPLLNRETKRPRQSYYRFLAILSLVVVVFAILGGLFALYPRVVGTTRMLAIPSNDNIGMDYYHESMGYLGRTDAEIDSDLAQIQLVTHKLKVYYNPFPHLSETGIDPLEIVKNIVRKAKARKMYVVWTENDDNVTLTDATWGQYAKKVIADAAEAHSVGADEFLVGNEISLHNNGDPGFNDINLPGRIKQLVIDCQTNFPGIKGYEEGWYKSESWHNATLGPLNKIYFSLYESWHNFKADLDRVVTYFGKKAEVGELSTMATKGALNDNEEEWARELMRRYDYARQKGIMTWLFAFRETHNDGFGLFQTTPPNQPHDIWNYLRGLKTFTYHEFLSDNFNNGTMQAFSGDGYNYRKRLRANAFNQVLASVPVPDYVFRGVASPISTSGPETWRAMRLVVRYSDINNYYFVDIEPNYNKVELFRRQGGVESYLAGVSTPLLLGTDYDFEIRVSGSGAATKLQVFWDTVKIIDLTDTGNSNLNAGDIGMKNNGVTGDIDDVVVTDFEQVVYWK